MAMKANCPRACGVCGGDEAAAAAGARKPRAAVDSAGSKAHRAVREQGASATTRHAAPRAPAGAKGAATAAGGVGGTDEGGAGGGDAATGSDGTGGGRGDATAAVAVAVRHCIDRVPGCAARAAAGECWQVARSALPPSSQLMTAPYSLAIHNLRQRPTAMAFTVNPSSLAFSGLRWPCAH